MASQRSATRAVQQHDRARAADRGENTESPGVAISVEHPRATGQRGDPGAILALIEEPACLLARPRIRQEFGIVLADRRAFLGIAPGIGAVGLAAGSLEAPGLDPALQPLECARRRIVAQHDAARRQNLSESVQQRRAQGLRGGGVQLDGEKIAIAVDDDARQAIRLGMDQPVEPAGIEPLAQGERRGKAAREEVAIDGFVGAPGQDAGRDQRARIEPGERQELAARGDQPNEAAGRQRACARIHGDLVGEDPGVAGAHALVPAGEQSQFGQGHGVHGCFLRQVRAQVNRRRRRPRGAGPLRP
jgi:hypothetical protein